MVWLDFVECDLIRLRQGVCAVPNDKELRAICKQEAGEEYFVARVNRKRAKVEQPYADKERGQSQQDPKSYDERSLHLVPLIISVSCGPCTPSCTDDSRKTAGWHGLMKAPRRFSASFMFRAVTGGVGGGRGKPPGNPIYYIVVLPTAWPRTPAPRDPRTPTAMVQGWVERANCHKPASWLCRQ